MKKSARGSILVVDDDSAVLDSSSLLLREYGYDVVPVTSAKEAMEKFLSNGFDAVVTDIVMPSVSGIELLGQIHDVDPGIPVILMTAYADMDKVIGAIKVGAFDFIIKPFSAELLALSVQKAVNYNQLKQTEKDYKHLLEEYSNQIDTLVTERTMSLMALTIADKIRNPASVIGLTCKRMLDKEDVPDPLRSKLRDIMDEAKKLDIIVKDFHSYLKSKESIFKYEDINHIVERVIPILENMAAGQGEELVFRPSESPLKINVQTNLFQIAVSHLIKNSIEATGEGGKIEVSIYEDGDKAVLSISDNGHGISTEDIDRIFDPLFSTKKQRFGMGLPLVKRIVSEHMGEIEAESEPGKGTKFIIKLPLRWTQN